MIECVHKKKIKENQPKRSLVQASICNKFVSSSDRKGSLLVTSLRHISIRPLMPAKEARMSWLAFAKARLLFILFRSDCWVDSIWFISAPHRNISLLAASTISNTKMHIVITIAPIISRSRTNDNLMFP